MKNILVLCVIFSSISIANASTYSMLRDKLHYHVSNDSSNWFVGTYIGSLKIKDVNEISDKQIQVEGTFNTRTEFGTTLTRHYTATLKKVLDDLVIMSCCWNTAFGTRWCTK